MYVYLSFYLPGIHAYSHSNLIKTMVIMNTALSMFLTKYLNLSMCTSMFMFPSLYMNLYMTHIAQQAQNMHIQQ